MGLWDFLPKKPVQGEHTSSFVVFTFPDYVRMGLGDFLLKKPVQARSHLLGGAC
jgi:hypothetical protein